jgi:hypothetical protein
MAASQDCGSQRLAPRPVGAAFSVNEPRTYLPAPACRRAGQAGKLGSRYTLPPRRRGRRRYSIGCETASEGAFCPAGGSAKGAAEELVGDSVVGVARDKGGGG